jgi:hypothetical protein
MPDSYQTIRLIPCFGHAKDCLYLKNLCLSNNKYDRHFIPPRSMSCALGATAIQREAGKASYDRRFSGT